MMTKNEENITEDKNVKVFTIVFTKSLAANYSIDDSIKKAIDAVKFFKEVVD